MDAGLGGGLDELAAELSGQGFTLYIQNIALVEGSVIDLREA